MDACLLDSQWIWHPQWIDYAEKSAGAFVHFRKIIMLNSVPLQPVRIQITADTKYKLYVNQELVAFGPVKGDERMWFYDELDIKPYLKLGINHIGVRVLRLFHATPFATSFPRLPQAGLLIRAIDHPEEFRINTDSTWETAIDRSSRLPIDIAEDDFLHIYEEVVVAGERRLEWVPAKQLSFPTSHGLAMPWQLSKRMIPKPKLEPKRFTAIHNLKSTQPESEWAKMLLGEGTTQGIRLPPGTSHHLELEANHHTTALIQLRFSRPDHAGSEIVITYSEAFEKTPHQVPYLRDKDDRRDTKKKLIGPQDRYGFFGKSEDQNVSKVHYHAREAEEEVFAPFHFRTFRFMTLDIQVAQACDLVMLDIDITATRYPLEVLADIKVTCPDQSTYQNLWTTSIRTLQNCMHDCYEDCPFYEQLQYAMDTRSSALFTYSLSSDDRLARQAIIQLHNSYNPATGLTCSRAPSHQPQIIPHFSLFWICMLTDHFHYFADRSFTTRFLPTCDAILASFAHRIDPTYNLIRALGPSAHWDFVDWTSSWRPMGIPPAGERTGFLAYTNMLYAYVLQHLAATLTAMGHRPHLATEYQDRAANVVSALQAHCFDGAFFTDGLAQSASTEHDYSQHSQIWAVLCGAAKGDVAREILAHSLSIPAASTTVTGGTLSAVPPQLHTFTPTSTAMSFYTLRALSLAGRSLYATHFHAFWAPWRTQLAQNLDTWCEDSVSLRSDCHAWGCAPIYEFVAEVAGLRPGEPGWNVVEFEPKVELFESVDVRVPFGTMGAGMARVRWWRTASAEGRGCECEGTRVLLSLTWQDEKAREVVVRVKMPSGEVDTKFGATELEFWFCDVSCPGCQPLARSSDL